MSLQVYRQKRNFSKTREPRGKRERASHDPIFVIQKHHASHLHYDFRLELDGVLKSWAVPKGPPVHAKEKRLAVEVEDHPIPYASFEGDIPEGEYGAGHVEIWDRGIWHPIGNAREQIKKGKLEFTLEGEKLSGTWMLVRTARTAKKPNWLLIKRSAKASVVAAKSQKAKTSKTSKLPRFVEPKLCTLIDRAPTGAEWLHEIKYDGYRTLARIEKGKAKLLTRSGLDWTHRYPEIEAECKKLKVSSCLIDGEIAWVDESGHTRFDGLQRALESKQPKGLIFYVFDLLFFEGTDLREHPLVERKALLQKLIESSKTGKMIFSPHQRGGGPQLFKSACERGMEGVIAKRADSIYNSHRDSSWLKVKCKNEQEFVIGGYALQSNGRSLGALLVGFNENGEFRYAGRVGTGFNAKNAMPLLRRLRALENDESPFVIQSPKGRDIIWVEPKLVAQVQFGAWTDARVLRHAAFKGLREDKAAKAVKVERAAKLESKGKRATALSNPMKVLYPEVEISKQDLADYYEKIEKWILPHVQDRPLSLLRCPDGVEGECFFQKHAESDGKGLLNMTVHSKLKKKKEQVLYIDAPVGLLELVQLGSLEIHTRGCDRNDIDSPNVVVFDLDPDPTVGFPEVKAAAVELRDLLERLNLKSFLKTTGGKGLHLHVPIQPVYDFDQIKSFAKTVCAILEKRNPKKFTTNVLKVKRKNRIFLDYLRNGYGATFIAPYSARAKPNASVAFPLRWNELAKLRRADGFTVTNVPALLKKRKDPWEEYRDLKQTIPALSELKTS